MKTTPVKISFFYPFLFLFFFNSISLAQNNEQKTLQIGDTAIVISGINQDGIAVSLPLKKGKVVLLHFWYMGNNRDVLDQNIELASLFAKFRNEKADTNFTIFSLEYWLDEAVSNAGWRKSVRKYKMDWNNIRLSDNKEMVSNVNKYVGWSEDSAKPPTYFLIDENGIIAGKWINQEIMVDSDFEKQIDKALEKREKSIIK